MFDGRLLARGQMKWVIQDERMSSGPSHPETIERGRLFGFSVFGNPQKKVAFIPSRQQKFNGCQVYYLLGMHIVQSLLFIIQMFPLFSLVLIIMDRLFPRLFNSVFSFNVRLLQVFRRGVLMELNSCSTRVNKLTKVWSSEGGGIHFILLRRGWLFVNAVAEKSIFSTYLF